MPIFSHPVATLSTPDLDGLSAEGAVENILLEFKAEMPAKDEFLKKVSSFANTYGGHIIIGAIARSTDGRLTSLPGVPPQSGLRQRLVQWAYEAAEPPIELFVSDAIVPTGSSGSVCYVVHVPMSGTAPHFLAGRKGCYVRTDEFSQRFEPRLASYDEIEHLRERRSSATQRRRRLWEGAVARFERFAATEYASVPGVSGPIGATMMLGLVPAFPTRALVEPERLRELVARVEVDWRQTGFPNRVGRRTDVITQHQTVSRLYPGYGFSLLDCSIWGQQFLGIEIEHLFTAENGGNKVLGIHLWALIGHILAFCEYARTLLQEVPYDGPLTLLLSLIRVQGKPFVYFPQNIPTVGPSSPFDDSVLIEQPSSTDSLRTNRDAVVCGLLRELFFALNWADQAANNAALQLQLKRGYSYNFWTREDASS